MTNTNYAVAPGAYLEEWIEERGASQQQVADMLGSSRKQVNEIINGHAPITSDTALRLERVVGIPADAWLRYEAMYRADRARITDSENLADHAEKIHPQAVAYLRKRGVTVATKAKPGTLVADFLAYHRFGTWEAYETHFERAATGDFALAALKEHKADLDQTMLSTWLRAGELTEESEHGRALTFDREGLHRLLPALRERTQRPDAGMLNDMADMLAEVGVVFFVLEPPKNFPLRGMTRWIDKRVPVIQQTGRWAKDGFVIWALFHELGHVLGDPRGEAHMDFTTHKKRTSTAERNANKFAMDTLLDGQTMKAFAGLTRPSDIARQAHEVGIAPGLAVFLMHRNHTLPYSQGNRLLIDLGGTYTLR